MSGGGRLALATPHRLATEAGVAAFRVGGTALDAALAAAAVLTVVAPQDCALGGDAIALAGAPDGTLRVLNGSGAAARAVDADALRARHAAMPIRGVDPITVPGAVAAWASLAALGARLPWRELLAAAIAHADEGVPVSAPLGRALAREQALLAGDPGLRSVFAPDGVPLTPGATLRQPALARTLRALAEGGAEALYEGEIGAALLAGLRTLGAPLDREDLAAHATELATPLLGGYADVEVATAPPNSQGFALLELLGALAPLGDAPDPLGPSLALLAELCRLAARDRDAHLADPRQAATPLARLLGPAHAAELLAAARASVGEPAAAAGSAAHTPGGDTVAIVALDDEGHSVSLIQSVFWAFGAGVLEPATGILCHNRGAGFSLAPDAPNALRGGARPPHSLMPVLVLRDGAVEGVHGTMGGLAQPQIHLQVLLRLLRGASAAEAVAAPRWIVEEDGGLAIERDAGVRIAGARELQPGDDLVGHAQLARRTAAGELEAGSDPRAGAAAAVAAR
ncbi:MAG TPA: gamma-glutamyltransferase [Conexibacter sp.]|nr:gamma-glutamyltransferase [Conexibacter sp.]